jgi:hypothetical protein
MVVRFLAVVVGMVDLAVALVAIRLHFLDHGATGLRRDEREKLRAADRSHSMHHFSLSRRRLLGTRA